MSPQQQQGSPAAAATQSDSAPVKTRFSDVRIDQEAAANGVWRHYGAFEARIAFASIMNKAFQARIAELLKPLGGPTSIQRGHVPAGDMLKALQRAYAEHIVKEWRGFVEEDGETPVPCTPERVMELFDMNPAAWMNIREDAENEVSFRVSTVKAQVGNSLPALSTR